MKVSVTALKETEKKVTVEIPSGDVQPCIDKKYRDIAKHAKVRGFRPGKVPRNILKSYYGKAVEEDVAQELINKTFKDVLDSHGIKPLVQPEVEHFEFNGDGAFVYTVVVEVSPEFEVEGYRGMELKKPVFDPLSEEEIDRRVEEFRLRSQSFQPVENQLFEEGYAAVIDGRVVKDDGSLEETPVLEYFTLRAGEENPYPSLARELVGLKAGDRKRVSMDFGDLAPRDDLKHKLATLEVLVREVGKVVVPDVDDEFAKDYGFESLEKMKETIRLDVEGKRQVDAKNYIINQIEKKLLETYGEIPLGERSLKNEMDRKVKDIEFEFIKQGIKLPKEFFENQKALSSLKSRAERSLRLRIILGKIAELEQIKITEEDEDVIIAEISRAIKRPEEEVRDSLKESPIFEKMKEDKLITKVMDFLEQHAAIVEIPASEIGQSESAEVKSSEEKTE